MRRIDYTYAQEGSFKTVIYQGEMIDGTYEEIIAEHPPISKEELEKLWVDYPKFGEYDQLIRLDRIPLQARERILENSLRSKDAHLQQGTCQVLSL